MVDIESRPLVAGVDKPVSALALGTAHFQPDSKDLWFSLLDRFVACGGAAIDTAHNYGEGEAIIGSWMADRSDRGNLVICTKGGHGTGILPAEGFCDIIGQELATSLDRLRTDYIDLYWLHRDNPSIPVGPILECLNEHLAAGRIARPHRVCRREQQPEPGRSGPTLLSRPGIGGQRRKALARRGGHPPLFLVVSGPRFLHGQLPPGDSRTGGHD